MDIRVKKLDFKQTLYYFLKDKMKYEQANCHINTYITFYDCNYKVVDLRETNFYLVTGLMIFKHEQKKYSVVHSWIEDCGKIIDVTSLTNSQLYFLEEPKEDEIDEIRSLLDDNVEYVAYSRIGNKKFTSKCREISSMCFGSINRINKEIEKYLQKIVTDVSDDSLFVNKISEMLHCEFKKDGFFVKID